MDKLVWFATALFRTNLILHLQNNTGKKIVNIIGYWLLKIHKMTSTYITSNLSHMTTANKDIQNICKDN